METITIDNVVGVFKCVKEFLAKPENLNSSYSQHLKKLENLLEEYNEKYKDDIPFFKLIKRTKRYQDYQKILNEIKNCGNLFPGIVHNDLKKIEEVISNNFEKIYRYPQYLGDSLNKIKFMPKEYLQEIHRIIKETQIKDDSYEFYAPDDDTINIKVKNLMLLSPYIGELLFEIKLDEKFRHSRVESSFRKLLEHLRKNKEDKIRVRPLPLEMEYYNVIDEIYLIFLKQLE